MKNILLVLPEIPWPPVTGGKRAHLATISRLRENGFNVKILACNTDTDSPSIHEFLASPFGFGATIVNTKSPALAKSRLERFRSLLRAAISLLPSHYVHLHDSQAKKFVQTELENHQIDYVWVDHLYALSMVPEKIKGIPLILSTQNVEADLTEQSVKQAKWGIKKLKRYIDSIKVSYWEPRLLARASTVITLSPSDAEAIRRRYHIDTAGTLIPLSRKPVIKWNPPPTPVLTFVGSFSFAPNQEAITWIIEKFSHQMFQTNPAVEIRLVGGGKIPDALKQKAASNIQILGRLSDDDFEVALQTSTALLSPIILGSGIKMKVVDAALLGIPIIATTFSVDGLFFIECAYKIKDRADPAVSANISAIVSEYTVLDRASKNTNRMLKDVERESQELIAQLCTSRYNL